jgi:acetyl-CoA acetyltransferase
MTEPSVANLNELTTRHLRGKYAIVGIGETPYTRGSGLTTRALAVFAVSRAMVDAGLQAHQIDGVLSHGMNDSTSAALIAGELGIVPRFYLDMVGGGASAEALVAVAIGLIESGACKTIAIFRSMNGYSQVRTGGTGSTSGPTIAGDDIHTRAYGWSSPAHAFAPVFQRHIFDYGTRPEDVAMVRVIHSKHGARNPKALYRKLLSVDDVLESRLISTPLRLLDCCVETDSGTCIIVTSVDRAKDCRNRPVPILSVVGRFCKPRVDMHYQVAPVTSTAAAHASQSLWNAAGIGPEDVDVTAAYDAFTYTSMLLLEDYGFCRKGEGAHYVSDGTIQLGGLRPNNTSGGLLCEGYSNGMNLIIENVRQLRHDADDACPMGPDGCRNHTFDYSETGQCRQVRRVEIAANLAWGNPGMGSAMVLGQS